MDRLMRLWRRLLFYLRRKQFDRELAEEMRFHLEMKAQENAEAGMKLEERRYAAQRQIGNQTILKDRSTQLWGVGVGGGNGGEGARVQGDWRAHAGAGDRREHGDFQRRQRRAAEAASLRCDSTRGRRSVQSTEREARIRGFASGLLGLARAE